MKATCPLARWTHSRGTDEHPSFAVFQLRSGEWKYNCYSCGSSGYFVGLWWKLHSLGVRLPLESSELLYRGSFQDEVGVDRLDYRVAGDAAQVLRRPRVSESVTFGSGPMSRGPDLDGAHQGEMFGYEKPPYEPPPEWLLERYQMAPMPEYVVRKGLADIHDEFGCGNNERLRRWVVPIRKRDGSLFGFTSRSYWEEDYCFKCGATLMHPRKSDGEMRRVHKCLTCGMLHERWVHTTHLPRHEVLFGAQTFQAGGVAVLVEGPTDKLRLWQYGVRFPLATLGSNWDPRQVTLLRSFEPSRVVLMGDGDTAGRKFNQTLKAALDAKGMPAQVVELPDGLDPGGMPLEMARELLPAECWR